MPYPVYNHNIQTSVGCAVGGAMLTKDRKKSLSEYPNQIVLLAIDMRDL